MNDIDDLLSNLVQGSTHIISKPETIEQLEKQGVKFEHSVPKSESEILDELFSQRRNLANGTIKRFPSSPQIAIPTIRFLYDEIREAIIFGLNGAAISLSAILIEFALKHAIVRNKRSDTYDKAEWDRIENIELGATISEAKSMEIIDGHQEKALKDFKDKIRNPYLHYNIKKITRNVAANKVKKVNINTHKVEELDIPAEENPILWGFAKKLVDRETVFDVFMFADRIVKDLFEGK